MTLSLLSMLARIINQSIRHRHRCTFHTEYGTFMKNIKWFMFSKENRILLIISFFISFSNRKIDWILVKCLDLIWSAYFPYFFFYSYVCNMLSLKTFSINHFKAFGSNLNQNLKTVIFDFWKFGSSKRSSVIFRKKNKIRKRCLRFEWKSLRLCIPVSTVNQKTSLWWILPLDVINEFLQNWHIHRTYALLHFCNTQIN